MEALVKLVEPMVKVATPVEPRVELTADKEPSQGMETASQVELRVAEVTLAEADTNTAMVELAEVQASNTGAADTRAGTSHSTGLLQATTEQGQEEEASISAEASQLTPSMITA